MLLINIKVIHSAILVFCLAIFSVSCGESAKPIPKDKESFVGIWKSPSGFELQIMSGGNAIINQNETDRGLDYENLNIKVAPSHIAKLRFDFRGDSIVTLRRPGYYARVYRIDKMPFRDSSHYKMILNGVTLIK